MATRGDPNRRDEQAHDGRLAWAVHVTTSGRNGGQETVGPIDIIYTNERDALTEAAARSLNEGTLAASVTRYVLDEMGTRSRVALYVTGVRQRVPHCTDDHRYIDG